MVAHGVQLGPDLHAGMFRHITLKKVRYMADLVRDLRAKTELPEADADLLDLLSELEVYVVDREVLSRTSIGKEVAALKQHKNPHIAQLADTLVGQWKKDMKLRDQVVDGFMEKASLKRRREAQDIEEGLFNATCPLGFLEGDDYRSYQRHYKRLCTHLRARGVGSLFQRLQSGELRPDQVATLPDTELISDGHRQQQHADQQEGLRAAISVAASDATGVTTEQYTCPRCKCNRTSYKEVQTGWHRDDQDLSILVQCLECGERWKESDDHGLNGS